MKKYISEFTCGLSISVYLIVVDKCPSSKSNQMRNLKNIADAKRSNKIILRNPEELPNLLQRLWQINMVLSQWFQLDKVLMFLMLLRCALKVWCPVDVKFKIELQLLMMNFDFGDVARSGCFLVLNVALDNLELYGYDINVPDKHSNCLLHYSAQHGNTETTLKLLTLKALPDVVNARRQTPLHLACIHQHKPIIKILADSNAKMNIKDHLGQTPLFYLANSPSLAEFLIAQGADINISNSIGETLLHVAVKAGKKTLVQYFLEHGLYVDAKTACGDTPLMFAVQRGFAKIVHILLEHGADYKIENHKSQNLLHLAVENQQNEVCERLLSMEINFDQLDRDGASPLHLAAQRNYCDIIRILAESNVKIDQRDFDNYTPLHVAASNKNNGYAVAVLLEQHASIDAVTCNGDLPLHKAAGSGNEKAVKLLYRKAFLSVKNRCGLTPLMMAEAHDRRSVVYLLKELEVRQKLRRTSAIPKIRFFKLKTKMAVEQSIESILADSPTLDLLIKSQGAKMKQGAKMSLVHMAVGYGESELVDFFLEHGSEVDAKTASGETPLIHAVLRGSVEIVDVLLLYGADYQISNHLKQNLIHLAVKSYQPEVCKRLFALNINVNQLDQSGDSPLHEAARRNYCDIIKMLSENNANIDLRNFYNATPLHVAAGGRKNGNAVAVLLEQGASVDLVTDNLDLPLHKAAFSGNEQAVRLLYRKEFLIRKNRSGFTPLRLAEAFGRRSVVRILKELEIRNTKTSLKVLVLKALPDVASAKTLLYINWHPAA
ncbi:hypothetical protein HUJ04_001716 [Dendroctonus ponderosae]|nr:hypothetical protein HUJ04_001716 [Dendroctonus ponderosae]